MGYGSARPLASIDGSRIYNRPSHLTLKLTPLPEIPEVRGWTEMHNSLLTQSLGGLRVERVERAR